MGLGIMGWRRVGLGICEVGGVGSGSNLAPWIFCSEEHLSMGGTENVILFSHLTVVISLSNPPHPMKVIKTLSWSSSFAF